MSGPNVVKLDKAHLPSISGAEGENRVKMEKSLAINPNPVLSVANDGTVLYSNEAGKPLLNEWDVEVETFNLRPFSNLLCNF